mmetsp:Transcript_47255/g.100855  ORF Transcript_47255/g.100855 Transcript_47255/m.100855 type:complete len:99 (-) Transcript_47255:272-568(-)
MGASYVVVRFGGVTGDTYDDLSKARWMARVSGSPSAALNNETLLYKLSYYRFGQTALDGYSGYDRARDAKINPQPIILHAVEEVITSEHWLVRVFRIL